MEASFWHERWEENRIGFHENKTNPLLLKYFERLSLSKGERVFLPLCGKSLDIAWLLSEGYQVAGAELSEIAIQQLFEELKLTPEIYRLADHDLIHYQAKNIDMFVGDIFDLDLDLLGPIDAVFDRAALIALPPETRANYASHLMALTANAPQLMICLEYDQSEISGPPFSISPSEVERHYATNYALSVLESENLNGGLKGQVKANETVWLLENLAQ